MSSRIILETYKNSRLNSILWNQGDLVKKATEFCNKYHKGQVRKGSGQPYSSHPIEVAAILDKFGYSDPITQSIALLHDVKEDTELTIKRIHKEFGFEVANSVFVLSRNTIHPGLYGYAGDYCDYQFSEDELYRMRNSFARPKIQRVKLADNIDNTIDLENLDSRGIEKKISEAQQFYIPIGKKIAPDMTKELEANILRYQGLVA